MIMAIPTRRELTAKVTELEDTVKANRISIGLITERLNNLESQKRAKTPTKKTPTQSKS